MWTIYSGQARPLCSIHEGWLAQGTTATLITITRRSFQLSQTFPVSELSSTRCKGGKAYTICSFIVGLASSNFNNGPLSLSLVPFKQMVPGHEIQLLLQYVLQHTKHFPNVPLCRNLPFFYLFSFHSDVSAGVGESHFNEYFSCVGNRSIHKSLQHLHPRKADRTVHANLNAKQMLPVF